MPVPHPQVYKTIIGFGVNTRFPGTRVAGTDSPFRAFQSEILSDT